MRLTEEQITEAIQQWVRDADADELARLAGEMFGGDCYWVGGIEYEFEPNLNYAGAFHEDK
jgi:hypothetical protein